MTLADAIREAVTAPDCERPEKIAKVAEFMRFNLGWNYEKSFRAVQNVFPQMEISQWDEMLYEADPR